MVEIEHVLEVMYDGKSAPYSRAFVITENEFNNKVEWTSKQTDARTIAQIFGFRLASGAVVYIDLDKAQGFKFYKRTKVIKEEDKPDNPDPANPLARNENLYDDPLN